MRSILPSRLSIVTLLCICLAVTACSSESGRKPADTSAPASVEASAASAETSDPRDEGEMVPPASPDDVLAVEVSLTGGNNAGTHTVRGGKLAACGTTPGVGVSATWENVGYAGRTQVANLSALVKTPSGSTQDFDFHLQFNDPGSNQYNIQPELGVGSGTATVTGGSAEFTIVIDGSTAGNVGVRATFSCLK